MQVEVSAIVVAYAKGDLLERCLTRLERALAAVDGETELIVVVNEMPSPIPPAFERAVVVAGGRALGFAGGVTAGLAVARGRWIALVNDDCMIEADSIAALVDVGEADEQVGSVAARVLFADRPGIVNSTGLEIDDLGVAREREVGARAFPAERDPVEVFGASATFGLFRRTMLDEVGGFDPSYFAYLEDADLAWRARMAGWRTLLAPGAVGLHHHSATLGHASSAKHFLVGRNRVRSLAKNATDRQLRSGLARIVAYDLLQASYASLASQSLAPLSGRLHGLAEWRSYRRAGSANRAEIPLGRSPGLRAALRRNRAYLRGAR